MIKTIATYIATFVVGVAITASMFLAFGCRTLKPIWVPELTPICNASLNLAKVIYKEKDDKKQVAALSVPIDQCIKAEERREIKIDRADCIKEIWLGNKVNWNNNAQKVHFQDCMKGKGH